MSRRGVRTAAPFLLLLLLLAACGGTAVSYVSAGDPVLAVCQAPEVQTNKSMVQAVDNANGTDPDSGWSGDMGQQMTVAQVADLQRAAASYRQDAARVSGHPAFAAALLNEAQEFGIAAASPKGLTTNTVAVAADQLSAEILAGCGSFQIGVAPKPGKPGPGLLIPGAAALGGYLLLALAASYLIAVGQRSRPRGQRLAPAGILWQSLAWQVFIFAAIARMWARAITSATLTADEKKDDRIAAQAETIRKLEEAAGKRTPDGEGGAGDGTHQ